MGLTRGRPPGPGSTRRRRRGDGGTRRADDAAGPPGGAAVSPIRGADRRPGAGPQLRVARRSQHLTRTGGTDVCSDAGASIDGELKRYHRHHCWSTRVPRRAKGASPHRPPQARTSGADPVPGRASGRGRGFARSTARRTVGARRALEPVVGGRPSSGASYPGNRGSGLPARGGCRRVHTSSEAAPRWRKAGRLLRFRHGLSQREIADRVGISQMQVSRVLRRALDRLDAAVAC